MANDARIRFEAFSSGPIQPTKFVSHIPDNAGAYVSPAEGSHAGSSSITRGPLVISNNIDDDTKLQEITTFKKTWVPTDPVPQEFPSFDVRERVSKPTNAFNFKPTIPPKHALNLTIPPFSKKPSNEEIKTVTIENKSPKAQIPIAEEHVLTPINLTQPVPNSEMKTKLDNVEAIQNVDLESQRKWKLVLNEFHEFQVWLSSKNEEVKIRNELLMEAEITISGLISRNRELQVQLQESKITKPEKSLNFTSYGVVFVLGVATWYISLLL
jgi:hypothetical protein